MSTWTGPSSASLTISPAESTESRRDPEWAAAITGVDEATIRDLARRIAGQRSVINASFSVQRANHGEQTYRMAVTLAALAESD
ncbi:MAG: hypothetical protein AB1679_23510 [Actinomycetota bacterium]